MSQAAVILPGSPLTGAAAATDMNAAWAAMVSLFSGSSAPTLGPGPAGALVEGQFWLDTSLTPNVWRMWDGSTWCPFANVDTTGHVVVPALGSRNIMGDNGGLEVWQRGAGSSSSFSFAASAGSPYTADRWYLLNGANQATTVAAVAGLTTQSNLAANIKRNNGQTGTTVMAFGYPLDTDELYRMRGQKVSLSLVAKGGINFSPTNGVLSAALYVGTGSVGKRGGGFAGETNVIQLTLSLGSNIQASGSGASTVIVPTNTTQGELQIFWTPTGTALVDDSVTIDDVQLEVGSFPSVFERLPFPQMLLGCKRHFQKTFLYGTAPAQNVGASTAEFFSIAGKAGATAGNWLNWRLPVSMRATPAGTIYNPAAANAQVRDESIAQDCSASSVNQVTQEHVLVTCTGNASTAVGNILGVHATADAGI